MVIKRKQKIDHGKSGRDKQTRQDKALDEALKNTFPASDPVAVEQPTTVGHVEPNP